LANSEPNERLSRGVLKTAAVCVLILAYATLSHYCNTRGAYRLGTVLALGPAAAVLIALAWQTLRAPLAVLVTVLGALLLYDVWPLLEKNFSVVYLLQECGMDGLLAVGFGGSLRAGRVALCTRLADKLHGPLSAAEIRYTRQVTLAWTVFFAALGVITVALYWEAPLAVWSAFVSFMTLPLMAAMFAAEYLVRGRVLPQTERRGLVATMRVFFADR
jgi:uncharacterized membrane protein